MNICFTKPTCGSKLPRKARETSGSTGRRKGLLRVIGQWICHETFCPNLQHKVILNPACAFFGKPCAGGRSILAGSPTGIGFHASLGSQALYHVAVTRRLCRRLKMIGSLEPAQVPKDTRRDSKTIQRSRKNASIQRITPWSMPIAARKQLINQQKCVQGWLSVSKLMKTIWDAPCFATFFFQGYPRFLFELSLELKKSSSASCVCFAKSFAESLMALMALSTHVPSRIEVKTCIATAPNNAKHFPEYYSLMLG